MAKAKRITKRQIDAAEAKAAQANAIVARLQHRYLMEVVLPMRTALVGACFARQCETRMGQYDTYTRIIEAKPHHFRCIQVKVFHDGYTSMELCELFQPGETLTGHKEIGHEEWQRRVGPVLEAHREALAL